jgi:hypothetical protein
MIGKSFKGELAQISLPDILEFLRASRKTGILSFRREGVRKSLYVSDGNVTFATSNRLEERLGDLLLQWGMISQDAYDRSVQMLGAKKRQGKILVEIGAITPKQLWEGVQRQIRHIVYSLFNWTGGTFFFSERDLPTKENITADVGITELIVQGIRGIKAPSVLKDRFASKEVILARMDYGLKERVRLEPFERHILELIDGQRSLEEVCRDSEIGEAETFRVLYMFISIGYVKVKGRKSQVVASSQPDVSPEEITTIVGNYNRMYSYLYRYMMREVGPIAEHVLNKYLQEIRDGGSVVFKNLILRKDGTLDEKTIHGNLNWLRANNQKETLVSSLNEFLYSVILAVKRTLGPEHESLVIETLKDLRTDL